MNQRSTRWLLFGGAALFALITALPFVLGAIGSGLYSSRNFGPARFVWQGASYVSFYDRDIMLFNAGDAAHDDKDYQGAITLFESATRAATNDDHFCMATYNWGQTLADWGAQVEANDKADALRKYTDALRVISAIRCTDNPTYHDKFEDLRKALLKKIAELSADSSQKQQSGNDSSESAKEIIEDHSQESLQQRQYENTKKYYERSSGGSDSSSSGGSNKFAW